MFSEFFTTEKYQALHTLIYNANEKDVQRALLKKRRNVEDFCVLISPVAASYLESMAQESRRITQKRFGKTIQLYAPLYLSNECTNICTYCGFSYGNQIRRKTLNENEIGDEAAVLKSHGFDHVLLVTGESQDKVGVDYIERAVTVLRSKFSSITIEVQPLRCEEYIRLRAAGVHAVLVYQETYDREQYKKHHPKGKKSNFKFRLDTPDRLGEAGIHKIGLGALLGLADWRTDAAGVISHIDYLEKKYWQTKYSVSFPRLRPAQGVETIGSITSERDLLQLICAYRLCNENIELSLSTRESQSFRDAIFHLGITSMSAGSKTEPGGYSQKEGALKQFEIDDNRSPSEVAASITQRGYEPVWKDWDRAYGS